jgi:hypothetical protein
MDLPEEGRWPLNYVQQVASMECLLSCTIEKHLGEGILGYSLLSYLV